ncbi:hypothetical protein ACU5AX_19045 [Sphingomonas sp. XXL09]|uniref:hypothetical protein n=1 Tax=Sphingomonas sp. XXL09 TaxID=3457787 RepID=UPI00406BBC15
MTLTAYRVARRTEPEFSGSWGLWADERQRWLDVIYPTEREATDMLEHLVAGDRRRGPPQPGRRW